MKISKYLLTGIAAITMASFTLSDTAYAKSTTYKIKSNKVSYYSKLPNKKHNFKVKVVREVKNKSVKVKQIKTVQHVKYAKIGNKWVKLSQLVKVANKHYSKQKDNDDSSYDDSNSNNDNNSDNSNSTNDNSNSNTTSNINWNDQNIKKQVVQAALDYLNQFRTNAGLPALKENEQLSTVLDKRAEKLIDNFAHVDSNGNSITKDVAAQMGFDTNKAPFLYLGENIAQGNASPGESIQDVGREGIQMFQDEGPENGDGKVHGHYENDMSTKYDEVGIGFSYDPNTGRTFLAVDFTNSNNTSNNSSTSNNNSVNSKTINFANSSAASIKSSSANILKSSASSAQSSVSSSASSTPSSAQSSVSDSTADWTSDSALSKAADTAVSALNQFRASVGAQQLQVDDKLSKVAAARAKQVMANTTRYNDKGGFLAQDVATSLGYDFNSVPFNKWTEVLDFGFSNVGLGQLPSIQDTAKETIENLKNANVPNTLSYSTYQDATSNDFNAVGIGANYDPSVHQLYLVLEMGNNSN